VRSVFGRPLSRDAGPPTLIPPFPRRVAAAALRSYYSSLVAPTPYVPPTSMLRHTARRLAHTLATAPPPLSDVTLTVNARPVRVPAGLSLLEAARAAGVTVPTLCAHPRAPGVKGLCRVCLVDVGGGKLAPACATPAAEGLAVQTDTPAVDAARRSALALLKAEGAHDCTTCEAAGRCELQDLLRRYAVVDGGSVVPRCPSHEWAAADDGEEGGVEIAVDDFRAHPVDATSPALRLDLSKCVECGRCVAACGALQGVHALGLVGRGAARHVAVVGDAGLASSPCIACGQCSVVCPTGAIEAAPHWRAVADAIDGGRAVVVAQVAPAARVSAAEEFGLAPGALSAGALVAALRAAGFHHVFDTNFAADVTVVEEAAELVRRLKKDGGGGAHDDGKTTTTTTGGGASDDGRTATTTTTTGGGVALLTSCCPAWVALAERDYPDLVPRLSTAKSPMMMLGSLIKTVWAPSVGVAPADVVSVAIMPCTAKKAEAARADLALPNGLRPVDYVLTVRELGRLLRHKRVPVGGGAEASFDAPLGDASGAAELFAASGGVAEAALRTVAAWVGGADAPAVAAAAKQGVRGLAGVREAVIPLPPGAADAVGGRTSLRVGVAAGVGAARALLARVREGERFDAIEVMACPGGCVGGGGQPKSRDASIVAKRARAVYALDAAATVQGAHENEAVKALYDRELGGAPGCARAQELLHRGYEGAQGKG